VLPVSFFWELIWHACEVCHHGKTCSKLMQTDLIKLFSRLF
jgi:hypothetical protein